jgi:DnaJ-class molecular chaperone
MEFKDYYTTLGVPRTASEKDIKQAFRKLARQLHPDVNPGDAKAEARFKEVNEAHEVLSDPEKRRTYDEVGSRWRDYAQSRDARTGGGGPAAGRSGSRPLTPEEVADMFGGAAHGAGDFSDFFETIFGGASRSRGRRTRRQGPPPPQRGADAEHEYELDIESAARGSVHKLVMRQGDAAPRTIDVRIPPGVTEGSRVRVSGEGSPGTGGAGRGDLFLRIRLKPHPVFTVAGRDVTRRVSIPVSRAVLGGEITVASPDGRSVTVRVPETSQPGTRLRVRGYGLPALGASGTPGDLYVVLDVALPRELSGAARQAYEQLARIERDE